ncbi:MAG: methyltransferase domain-containing protein [Alphaproteobacteria bacterium]|nr:methyltransferase domain-containing protein [Alphaproteobacteria bacterium SS10]
MVEQRWDAEAYARHARFVTDLGEPVFDLLSPVEGETIIDLGCGDGVLTQRIAEKGAKVIGVDADPDMVAAADELGLDARVADATDFDLGITADAVFSNAALHWIKDADKVIERVKEHLKPGGRFVAEFGGFGNIAAISTALRSTAIRWGLGPDCLPDWYFPTEDEYRELLEDAGFAVLHMQLHPRQTRVTAGMEAWLEIMTAKTIGKLPVNEREAFVKEVRVLLEPTLKASDGTWYADYVRLRFHAVLPEELED